MLSVIGCACGMDPATEGMIVQVAIAGVVSVPFFFRERAHRFVRRLRRMPDPSEEWCDLASGSEEEA